MLAGCLGTVISRITAMSYSFTTSETFSIIHARKLSAKVAADMHLCAQYYGRPSEEQIRQFAEELAQYLNGGHECLMVRVSHLPSALSANRVQ